MIDPGPDRRRPRRRDRRRVDARSRAVGAAHAHASRSLAGRATGSAKKTGAVVAGFGKIPKADEVDLKLDLVLDRRRHDRRHRVPARGAAHARSRAEPPVLLPRRGARRCSPGDHVLERHDHRREPAARRRHGAVPRVARTAAQDQAARAHRARPRRRDRGPDGVLDEYVAHRKMRERQILKLLEAGPGARSPTSSRRSTPTRPTGSIEMAQRQVHAHLAEAQGRGQGRGLGLQGRVVESVNRWTESGRTL